ncbi:MAG: glycosyltransferase [Planctomycetes bacterium]|nr:glycosyltransferase [Planctomycetota bacterium]
MLEFVGARILADEDTVFRNTWNPAFGLWKPEYRRVDASLAERREPVFEDLLEVEERPAPTLPVLWRGYAEPGDSLGNVTWRSLEALRRLGLAGFVRFLPIQDPAREVVPGDAERRSEERRGEFPCANPESATRPGTERLEFQVPGLSPSTLPAGSCVRFLYGEFGAFLPLPYAARDILWAPSRHVEESLRRSFPRHRTIRVPHGVDLGLFHPAESEREDSSRRGMPGCGRPFRFLYVGTTLSRKGFDLVLDAYEAERSRMPDSELVLKLSPTWSGFRSLLGREGAPGIRVVEDHLSEGSLADLMRSCDVLVAPARSEGFCLPVLEAMACGIPAIVPDGGATDDFCPDDCRYSVRAERAVSRRHLDTVLTWLEPNLDSLRAEMRRAHADPSEARARGARGARFARAYSWENVVKRLLEESLRVPGEDSARVVDSRDGRVADQWREGADLA